MGRDLPDGTRKMILEHIGGFVGLEELAARLGSIVPSDMGGNVILLEDFEAGLSEWNDDSFGGASTVAISTTQKYSGSRSVKMVAGGGATAFAKVSRVVESWGAIKYGVFCRWWLGGGTEDVELNILVYDGTNLYIAAIRYDREAQILKVYGSAGAFQNVATSLKIGDTVEGWYPMLFTFDLATPVYGKVIFGGQEYDLSSYAPYSEADDDPDLAIVAATQYYGGEGTQTLYVDDIIVARNVP